MAATVPARVDLEELEDETRPMTDSEHQAVFGWGWDDPDRVEGLS